MKTLGAVLLLAITLVACGQGNSKSQTLSDTSDVVIFSRDMRNADGDLKAITLTPSADGLYTATLRTAYFDRVHRAPVDNVDTLAAGLSCSFSDETTLCQRDDRSSDGMLVELTMNRQDDGTFTAKLRKAYHDRAHGSDVDDSRSIASDLKRQ